MPNYIKVGFWNVNQKKSSTTDIFKIANFDIIGLNEVGKEVILDDYKSFIVKDDREFVTCQLLCKKEIKIKKLECNQKGDFIAVEIEDGKNQGCIIIVTYINPTPEKKEWREDTIDALNELIHGGKDRFITWKKIIMGDFNYDFWNESYKKEKSKKWSQDMLSLEHEIIFKSVKDFTHIYKTNTGISLLDWFAFDKIKINEIRGFENSLKFSDHKLIYFFIEKNDIFDRIEKNSHPRWLPDVETNKKITESLLSQEKCSIFDVEKIIERDNL